MVVCLRHWRGVGGRISCERADDSEEGVRLSRRAVAGGVGRERDWRPAVAMAGARPSRLDEDGGGSVRESGGYKASRLRPVRRRAVCRGGDQKREQRL